MELSWTLVAIVAVVAMGIGFVLGRKGGGNVVQVSSGPGPGAPVQTAPGQAAPVQVARPLPQRPGRQAPPPGELAGWEEEARELLAQGNKIQAIKVAREATGLGLKEAKDLVESWERGH